MYIWWYLIKCDHSPIQRKDLSCHFKEDPDSSLKKLENGGLVMAKFVCQMESSRNGLYNGMTQTTANSSLLVDASLRIRFPPQKWRHFEDPKSPLRHTGSTPSTGGSNDS